MSAGQRGAMTFQGGFPAHDPGDDHGYAGTAPVDAFPSNGSRKAADLR